VRLASNLEKDGVVLAGERRSVKIEGSPSAIASED